MPFTRPAYGVRVFPWIRQRSLACTIERALGATFLHLRSVDVSANVKYL